MKRRTPSALQFEDQARVTIGTKPEEALFDSVWQAFHEKHAEQKPPAGAINAELYAEKFGGTRDRAHMLMVRAEKRGELHSNKFKVVDRGGKIRAVRYWWAK